MNLSFLNRRDLLRIAPAAAAAAAAAMTPARAAETKGRLRPALCAYSYREELQKKTLTYEDLIRIAADSGVDGLDATVYWMPAPIPDDGFLFSLKKTAYRHAVGIYSIAIRTDMCRPTASEQNQEFEKVRQWVDVAVKLGAGHIRVFGGVVPKGATEDQAATWASEVLKRSAEYSGKRGVILGLENHGGITDKAETIVRIVKAADSPWVGINLDTGNFRSNVFPQIAMCIPHAVNVQVKIDQVLEVGKRGPGDWNRVARMLVDGGYQGYMSLEYESRNAPGEVPPLLRKLSAVCRSMSA